MSVEKRTFVTKNRPNMDPKIPKGLYYSSSVLRCVLMVLAAMLVVGGWEPVLLPMIYFSLHPTMVSWLTCWRSVKSMERNITWSSARMIMQPIRKQNASTSVAESATYSILPPSSSMARTCHRWRVWTTWATHSTNPAQWTRIARFINDSTEVREKFDFAYPQEVLKAIQVYCCDGYGSMLWALDSDTSESHFKSWNTAVKIVYNVPRSTFTYLVEGHLAAGFTSPPKQIMSRYPTFFQSLMNSPSREVALLARIVAPTAMWPT